MSVELLQYLSEESVHALREKQTSQRVKSASDEVLVTLVAIKILNDHYCSDKKLWTFVEKKSRKAILPKLGISAKMLSEYLGEVNPCFKKGQWNK